MQNDYSIYNYDNVNEGFNLNISSNDMFSSNAEIKLTVKCSKKIFEELNLINNINFKKISIFNEILETHDLAQMNLIFNWAVSKNFVQSGMQNLMSNLTELLKDQKKEKEKPALQENKNIKKEKSKNLKKDNKENLFLLNQGNLKENYLYSLKENEIYYDEYNLISGGGRTNKISPQLNSWFVAYALININREKLSIEMQQELDFIAFQIYSKVAPHSYDSMRLGIQVTPQHIPDDQYHRLANLFLRDLNEEYKNDMDLINADVYLIDSLLFKEVIKRYFDYVEIENDDQVKQLIDDILLFPQLFLQDTVVDLSKVCNKENLQKFKDVADLRIKIFNDERPNEKKSMKNLSKLKPIVFDKYLNENLILAPKIKGIHNINFSEALSDTGFCLTPDHAKKAFLKINPLSREFVTEAKLSTAGNTIPTLFKDVQEFANSSVLQKFKNLADNVDAPPYLKIQAKSTAELLKGLSAFDLEAKFENEMKDLLQISYFIMINAMNEAIFYKDDFINFNNQIEVIHQVLQSILELTQPYNVGDFSLAKIDNLKNHNIIPQEIENPKVHLKASGMRALSSVVSAIERQINSKCLYIAVLKDSYYESVNALKHGIFHKCVQLNGDIFKKDSKGAMQEIKNPIDLFATEFHHNISAAIDSFYPSENKVGRLDYSPENVNDQIKAIINFNKGHPLNVVIDHTIGLEYSDEMRQLLSDEIIQNSIKNGILNLVILKSAQKFDMFGQDNYYGGIITAYNNSTYFQEFNNRMNHELDQLKGFNYQGLTHIQKFAGSSIDEYQKAIADNNSKLYKKLEEKGVKFGEYDGVVKIAKNSDVNTPFIHIEGVDLEKLKKYAIKNNLPLTYRASFGFVTSNISEIYETLRFNVGLESEEIIEKYAIFLANAQKKNKRKQY